MSDKISDILGLQETIKQLDVVEGKMKTLADSIEKIAKANIKADDAGKQKKKAEETEKLTVATKNYQQQQQQLGVLTEKLRVAEGNYNIAIIKKREELNATNRAIKENIKVSRAQAGSLVDVESRLKKLKEEFRNTAKPSKELIANIQRLDKESKGLSKTIGENSKSVATYKEGFEGAGKSLLGFSGVVGGVILGFRTLFSAVKDGVGSIRDFSSAQSTLASVLGVTKKDIKELTEDSLKYGASTQFTATQVANLQTELAKLGFTQKEIKDSTGTILDFATATGAELADAAKVTGVALRAFNLDSSEAARVTSALSVATTKSALSFADYETILATLAPVAKAYGFSLEDTIALTGKLKDAGFDASSAATASRSILLNLADSNGALAQSLGGSVESFDELIPAMINLREKGVDLNETLQLTDVRSVAAFNTFLQTAEGASKLRDDITGVEGKLRDMVDVKLDNLEGDTIKLSSAWDGLVLSFSASEKGMRGITQAATRLVNLLSSLGASTEKQVNLYRLENREVDTLLNTLKSQNLTSEARNKLITEVNEKYGEYLPNLLTEKSTLEDIELAQKAINKQLRLKVLQQAFQEEINALLQKELQAQKGLVNIEIERAKQQQNYDPTATKEEIKFKEQLGEVGELLNKGIIENNENEIESTREKFKRIAAIYNIAFEDIENQFAKADENIKKTAKTTGGAFLEIKEIAQRELQDIGDVVIPTDPIQDFYASFIDEEIDWITEREDNLRESAQRIKDIEADIQNSKRELMDRGFEFATNISNQEADNRIYAIDRELEAVNDKFAVEKALYEGNGEALAELEARQIEANRKAEAEKRAIALEAAKRERAILIAQRAIALYQIFKDTEAAVSAMLSPITGLGPVAGVAPAALLKIRGLLSAAQVAAAPLPPLPKLFTGTDNFKGGLAIVGDRYGTEGIITPSGKAILTPSTDTLAYMPKGTQVIPNRELATHPVFSQYTKKEGGGQFSDKGIIKAIKSQPIQQMSVSDSGIFSSVKRGNNVTIYKHKLLGR